MDNHLLSNQLSEKTAPAGAGAAQTGPGSVIAGLAWLGKIIRPALYCPFGFRMRPPLWAWSTSDRPRNEPTGGNDGILCKAQTRGQEMRKLFAAAVGGVLCLVFLASTTEHVQYTAHKGSCAREDPFDRGGFGLCPADQTLPGPPVGRGVQPRMQQPPCSDPCVP